MADVQLSALLAGVSDAGARAGAYHQGRAAPAPEAAAPPPASTAPVTDTGRQALELATQRIREYLNSSSATLEFSIDQHSGRPLLRVIDLETGQLIRQIPSEEVLAIARALDHVQGLLLQQRA
jgi:flagellar protein FlaG